MSNALVSEKTERFVVGPKPISKEAIALARYEYKFHYVKEPQILRLHPSAYRSLMQQLDPYEVGFETIMGLTVEYEPDYKEEEWRVGNSLEILTVRKAYAKADL